jgi:2,3-bisphosphoglycerate-dependent phosphoglycerate mutase
VPIQIAFETHSPTLDNENGLATGWLPGQLSAAGRKEAMLRGSRRKDDGLAAVFCSDLARAVETAAIAFGDSSIPVLLDWRLRECDYGELNGSPVASLRAGHGDHLDNPYPGGESWRQATSRVGRFLTDLPARWSGTRVLVIGHVATMWGLEIALRGATLEDLTSRGFDWQPGWEYLVN